MSGSHAEWRCMCGQWNPIRRAFCSCGKNWQKTAREAPPLETRGASTSVPVSGEAGKP